MHTVLLFPGQGSQFVGMGADLAQNFKVAQAVFAEVDDSLSRKLSSIIFEGELDELTRTTNAQPAIMAVSMAIMRVLQTETEFVFDCALGHSLGEYSALAACTSLTLAETSKLLAIRSSAMECNQTPGAMLALLGASFEDAQRLCDALSKEGVIVIANDNGAGQIVLSGERELIARAQELARDYNIKRAIALKVSQAFHSPLMASAEGVMKSALVAADIKVPQVAVIQNVTALPTQDPEQIRTGLVEQVSGRVRFRESINQALAMGGTKFVEVGPGKVLTNLVKSSFPQVETHSIQNILDIRAYLQ